MIPFGPPFCKMAVEGVSQVFLSFIASLKLYVSNVNLDINGVVE